MNDNQSDSLNCCEYINMHEEKSTIVSDICICPPCGNCCSTIFRCPPSKKIEINVIVANIQDRFRIPWHGGARQISLDSAVPLIIFPAALYIAAQGFWPTIILFPLITVFLYFVHRTVRKFRVPTKFFYVWTLTSAFLVFIIFQSMVVPMLDINNNENFAFIIIMAATTVCFYFAKKNAIKSHSKQELEMTNTNGPGENIVLLNEEGTLCTICRQPVPSRTYHCYVCKTCIIHQHVHSYWIDCCIGKYNRKPYISGLLLGTIMFTFLSNLILTTLCHPFKVFATVMLPDDCSDVYFDIMYGICFVTGLYCSIVAGLLLCMFINDVFLVSMDVTNHEWQERCKGIDHQFIWSRHILRNVIFNWKTFLKSV